MILVYAPMYTLKENTIGAAAYESAGFDDVHRCHLRVVLVEEQSVYFWLMAGRMMQDDIGEVQTLINQPHEDYIVTDDPQTLYDYFMLAWTALAEEGNTTALFGQGDIV